MTNKLALIFLAVVAKVYLAQISLQLEIRPGSIAIFPFF